MIAPHSKRRPFSLRRMASMLGDSKPPLAPRGGYRFTPTDRRVRCPNSPLRHWLFWSTVAGRHDRLIWRQAPRTGRRSILQGLFRRLSHGCTRAEMRREGRSGDAIDGDDAGQAGQSRR